jgi:hypothetical protein
VLLMARPLLQQAAAVLPLRPAPSPPTHTCKGPLRVQWTAAPLLQGGLQEALVAGVLHRLVHQAARQQGYTGGVGQQWAGVICFAR